MRNTSLEAGDGRFSIGPHLEHLVQNIKENDHLIKAAKFTRTIGGGVLHHPALVSVGLAVIILSVQGFRLANEYFNFLNAQSKAADKTTPIRPPTLQNSEFLETNNAYARLQTYLNAGFTGGAVGPNGESIGSLLSENEFAHTLPHHRPRTRPAEEVSTIGSKVRWFPAYALRTELPGDYWRQYCSPINESLVVSTTQFMSDGTIMLFDWLAEEGPNGWRFTAFTHTVNGITDNDIVAFPTLSEPSRC